MPGSSIFKYICLSVGLFLAVNDNIVVIGTPIGAPVVACEDMTPAHGFDAQTTPSPFATTPAQTQIGQDTSLTLTLATTTASTFKGFLVIGFDNANPSSGPIGSFSAISDGKTLDCPGISVQNAATHQRNNTKTSVTMEWTPPQGFVGTVLFKTTYVENTATFWVQTLSPLVTVA